MLTYLELPGANYSQLFPIENMGATESSVPIKYVDNFIPPHFFLFKPAE